MGAASFGRCSFINVLFGGAFPLYRKMYSRIGLCEFLPRDNVWVPVLRCGST